MLREEDISVTLKCQDFESVDYIVNPEGTEAVVLFESRKDTKNVLCPVCGGKTEIHSKRSIHLKDMPIWYGVRMGVCFIFHRYCCRCCQNMFSEEIPVKYPGTRITKRAAEWVKALLKVKMSIRAVQDITGIHWDTVRRIHKELMQGELEKRAVQLKSEGYKPRYLAVDEFAIHKGHTYATCVMDLERGDILWVGKGRSKADFQKFFDDVPFDMLSEVAAVAMDMNASYHLLVEEHLPQAKIVYDRYHMQAQFGKEVLGVVRLAEAKQHNDRSKEIQRNIMFEPDITRRKELKALARKEMNEYSDLKKLRWSLLRKSETLSGKKAEHLKSILNEHSDLAVCYAMKEELTELFKLDSPGLAEAGWKHWFEAGKESEIPALKRFAELKECRLDGLVSHAVFPISTAKLEGFNNKIKVAKRIGYGYRDDDYFFLLVRFLSLPDSSFFHHFP